MVIFIILVKINLSNVILLILYYMKRKFRMKLCHLHPIVCTIWFQSLTMTISSNGTSTLMSHQSISIALASNKLIKHLLQYPMKRMYSVKVQKSAPTERSLKAAIQVVIGLSWANKCKAITLQSMVNIPRLACLYLPVILILIAPFHLLGLCIVLSGLMVEF